jgi:hypothetical protein
MDLTYAETGGRQGRRPPLEVGMAATIFCCGR